jgi:hypothetical protein
MAGMKRRPTIAQVQARIESLKEAIRKANEYLESGEHANWRPFRAVFNQKVKDGKELPPHKDWVRNVYLRDMERMLCEEEQMLWRIERENKSDPAH